MDAQANLVEDAARNLGKPMAIDATHDFGTVILYESSGVVEATFPFADMVTRNAVRGFKARFDKTRKSWRIDPHYARCGTADIVGAIRAALVEAAPQSWRDSLPALGGLVATTRDFEIKAAEGGIRLALPPGHVHEWTLKNSIKGPEKVGNSWFIQAIYCDDGPVKNVIRDVMRDDMKALSAAVDYLAGFRFSGKLDLTQGEPEAIGLAVGSVIFANPAFMRKADPILEPERITEYVLEVASMERDEDDKVAVTLRVVHGQECWKALRVRYARPPEKRSKPLDVGHLWGKWVKRRS